MANNAPENWHDDLRWFNRSSNLVLDVPYKQGDIVKFDSRPFTSIRYGCLYNFWGKAAGEVSVLYKNQKGLWEDRSLHYNDYLFECYQLSGLYRIKKVEDELPDNLTLLNDVRAYVSKNKENGEILWNRLLPLNPITDNQLKEILDELNKDA